MVFGGWGSCQETVLNQICDFFFLSLHRSEHNFNQLTTSIGNDIENHFTSIEV